MSSASQLQPEKIIAAAGGILLRKMVSGDEQICIVLRRLRNDWTLPKGKLKVGESFLGAAHREVKEETGWDCELGDYLGAVGYEVAGVPKVVLLWRMSPIHEGNILSEEEIIKAEWVSIPEAGRRLTYDGEREFLGRIMGLAPGDESLQAVRTGYSLLDRLFQLKRARARLARECVVFGVELEFLERRSNPSDLVWAQTARRHLVAAKKYEAAGEIEGGWVCLHAAERQIVFALDQKELVNRAQSLRSEAKKILSWRAEAICNSLEKEDQITPERVGFAMALRDEHFANQYHKVWLSGDQLGILLKICTPALLVLLLLTGIGWRAFSEYPARAWHWVVVLAVMIFGLLGASFSCAQSMIGDSGTRTVPQRVADHYVTVTRSFSGIIVGLAGYAFFISKAFTIAGVTDTIGAAFAIAFIFGYTGEKLVARVANSGSDRK